VLPALASGLLFSLGLTVSQMINPAKVIGLLDVFGDWDPNLAFVMATAIPVTVAGYGCKTAPIAALCRAVRIRLCSAQPAASAERHDHTQISSDAFRTFGPQVQHF
jgi:uncharacterized membrane protein YedE/YeeE